MKFDFKGADKPYENLINTVMLSSLEYIIEVGIDEAVKEVVNGIAEDTLRLYPHVFEKYKELKENEAV